MSKKILINRTSSETRSVILEDGNLVKFFVERPDEKRMVGDIYVGKVENVVRGIKAAFIDIGHEENAFLPFSEISSMNKVKSIMADIKKGRNWEYKWDSSKNNNNIDIKSGKEVLVQIIKEPFDQKGARVTTDITIPGRFLVLVPFANYIGVSKNISDKGERKRLKKLIGKIKPKGYGVIVRTVGRSKGHKTLKNDLNYLVNTWKSTKKRARNSELGTPVFKDVASATAVIRDFLTENVDEIVIDDKKLYKKLKNYISHVAPNHLDHLKHYKPKETPLFYKYDVKKELDKSLSKKIWLDNGGFVVIEHTEAMTTVDVNSGKCVNTSNQEQISTKTNLLAARETARQLNLRDIGGLIVIDFIHMSRNKNKKKVYDELKKELNRDKAKVAVAKISKFGLLEMTRERTGENLTFTISEECPVCHGSGRIPSKASLVTRIENWFKRFQASKETGRFLNLHIHPELAHFINEHNKHLFKKIQLKNFMRVKIVEDTKVNIDEFKVITKKDKKDITSKY